MSEEVKWEPVVADHSDDIKRLRVPGGWLYKARGNVYGLTMVFVPEPPNTKGMNAPR